MSTAPTLENTYAQSLDGAYVFWRAAVSPQPRLVAVNADLADELGIDPRWLGSDDALAVFAGARSPEGATPIAQAYAGHQFGSYSPLLGDGRALLLGELIDTDGQRRDIAFKGSGATPFSRGGDGKAALGPVLREYLMGEAMHRLGIATTRALAAVVTGEQVRRETLVPGAILTRVAASHLRVGTFEFAARRSVELLRAVADYAIDRHYPDLSQTAAPQRYLDFFSAVAQRQAELIAAWMGVGFIHGVMNTDNMTISGETIDYGPCAFMEAYDPRAAFSSIDQGRRYAYANQPTIAQWNLTRLAETLIPLVAEADSPDSVQRAVDGFTDRLNTFDEQYRSAWLAVMRRKLGVGENIDDGALHELATAYLELLSAHRVDFTLGFRHLTDAAAAGPDDAATLRALFAESSQHPDGPGVAVTAWLDRWRAALPTDHSAEPEWAERIRRANPLYIPRNHQVERALDAAVTHDDLQPFHELLAVLGDPFTERPGLCDYASPAPAEVTARYRTFCGT